MGGGQVVESGSAEGGGVVAVFRGAGEAERRGQGTRGRRGEAGLGDGVLKSLGDAERVMSVGAWEDDGEGVVVEADDGIAGAEGGADDARGDADGGVGEFVAERFADVGQVVHGDDQEREGARWRGILEGCEHGVEEVGAGKASDLVAAPNDRRGLGREDGSPTIGVGASGRGLGADGRECRCGDEREPIERSGIRRPR